MRPATPPLNALRAFEAAARHQSFTRAADELHVTPGAISQQVSGLEERLGILLFRRIKKRLEITDAGKNYLVPLRDSLDRIELATVDLLYHGGSGGNLRIGALPSLASYWLIPNLPVFAKLYPNIRLSLSTLYLDFASKQREPSLEGGYIDIGLFYGDGHWDNLAADLLLEEYLIPVVSPDIIDPESLDDLRIFGNLPLLYHTTRPNSWAEWFQQNNLPIEKPRGYGFEHFQMLIDAAKAGLGIAIVPSMFVQTEIEKGTLMAIHGKSVKSRRAYYLVYDPVTADDPKIRSFKSWALETVNNHVAST
ncbi:MAG: LysR family transcriptional regulator [Rhizobiales bacterium]|nr:LysR substrate-binding domain-containing protein [Hyphomicrobiales bacterium]NRB15735.1 LysR family transcriptional regulator [Hyphomicrobiales bacterium]